MSPVFRGLRVLHSIASLDPSHGGPSRTVPRLCTALRTCGVEVELSVWASSGVRSPANLTRAVEGMQLVHDHGLWLPSNHAAAVAARRADRPRIVSPRGMLSVWALGRRRWKKRVAWHLYQRRDLLAADVIHATSGKEVEDIRRAGMRHPIALVPNGVDLPRRTRDAPSIDTRRRALFLSRMHPGKGLANLLEAWARVKPAGWELVVAGPDEGGFRVAMAKLARRLKIEALVRLGGPVGDEEKWDVYRQADLFVLPTLSENFGMVVAEALASGVPVITTKAAPWQALERDRCGWWIDVGVEPLAAALTEATGLSDEQRMQMGQNGRRHVERAFSWDGVGTQMAAVYGWLCGMGQRPPCVHLD